MRKKKGQRERVHHTSPGEFTSRNLDKLINEELYNDVKPIRPSRNKFFNEVIQELIDMHDKKNQDYSNDDNPFSNFDFAAEYGKAILRNATAYDSNDSLNILKGTKLARIYNIVVNRMGNTNNESLDDSEMDFVVYWILHKANRRRLNDKFNV